MFDLIPFRRRESDLTRPFDPFNMNHFLEHFFNDTLIPSYLSSGFIKVDIKENEKDYIVEAELPGINKEDISIELQDNLLTISVEHREEINGDSEKYIRKERRYGTMKRSFKVENIDEQNVTAKFENGLLSIVLPKKNPGIRKANRINIH